MPRDAAVPFEDMVRPHVYARKPNSLGLEHLLKFTWQTCLHITSGNENVVFISKNRLYTYNI